MIFSLPLFSTFVHFLGLGHAIAAFSHPAVGVRKAPFRFSRNTYVNALPQSRGTIPALFPRKKLSTETTSSSSKQSSDFVSNAFDKYTSNMSVVGLDKWGLFDVLTELDMKVTQEGCEALLEEFDVDKNGVIDRDEFLTLIQEKIAKDVFEIFCAFEHRGYLTPGKLRSALGALSVDLNSKKTKELVQYYDANGDGKLGPFGFSQLVSRSPTAKFWLKIDQSGHIRKIKASLIKALKSGPKKVVSRHSTLATIYTGMSLYSLSMLWAPGRDALGSRRILDLMCTFSVEQERMFRCTSLLSAFVAFSGIFRIPANSTGTRRNLFMATVWFVMNCAVTAESNLCLMPHLALIDAWSLPGRALVGGTQIAMIYFAFKLLHNSIVDPVEEFKSLPLMTSRPTAILSSVLIVIGMMAQFFPACSACFFEDKAFFLTWGMNRGINFASFVRTGGMTFMYLSLIMTLRFENKIGKSSGMLLSLLLVFIGLYDAIFNMFGLAGRYAGNNVVLDAIHNSNNMYAKQGSILAATLTGVLITVVNALLTRMRASKNKFDDQIIAA